ncbi:MAG: hypothetical protein CVV24_06935 [Ignavibacteriae bacterium HGW-Ignavibacteriae-3]|nr:MAG: hypothetical protein CVV24_06935 [Ignavibacteriae bacterium HGW-Ignavibacteriae-3]
MNCDEIKISLHDFADDELDGFQKNEIETHLRNCDNCFNQYKRVKKFFNIINELPPPIKPPAELIDEFSAELLSRRLQESDAELIQPASESKKLGRESKIQEKPITKIRDSKLDVTLSKSASISGSRSSFFSKLLNWGQILLMLLPIIILAAGYLIYDFQKYNSPWNVITNSGRVVINGLLNHSGKISQGEGLLTDESSKATVYVPKIGSVIVDQNSFLVLVKTKDGTNKIHLKTGAIKVTNTSTMPDLVIELKYFTVIDRGGQFSVIVDKQDNVKVTVMYGLVEIKSENGSVSLVDEYSCEIAGGLSIGTPCRESASAAFKEEVRNFDFGNMNSTEKIIELAETNDVLTLLGMISKADRPGRELLFETVSGRFRPPAGVTRDGILNADERMIYLWWQEIEWQL